MFFSQRINWTLRESEKTIGEVTYNLRKDLTGSVDKFKQLKKALFIIDPRLNRNNISKLILPTEDSQTNKIEEEFYI